MQKITLSKEDIAIIKFLAAKEYNEMKVVKFEGVQKYVEKIGKLYAKIEKYERINFPNSISKVADESGRL